MRRKLWNGMLAVLLLVLFSVTSITAEAAQETYEVTIGTSKQKSVASYTMKQGDKTDFGFYGVKDWGKHSFSCEWKSSDKKVATVDKNGLVTAVAAGKATITVAIKDKTINKTYKVQPLTVTVEAKPTKILTPTPVPLKSADGSYNAESLLAEGALVLSAKAGFASTIRTKETDWAAQNDKGIKLYIQDMESWSGGAVVRSNRGKGATEGTATYSYKFVDGYDEQLLKDYFTYLEKMGFYTGSSMSSATYVWQNFVYEGTADITTGLVDSCDYKGAPEDMEIWREKFSKTFGMTLPLDVSVKDLGDRRGGKSETVGVTTYTNTTAVQAETTSTGLWKFTISGWNETAGDEIRISLHPDLCKTGAVFGIADFMSQANAGKGALYRFCVNSEEIARAKTMRCFSIYNMWEPDEDHKDKFVRLGVTVLEKTDSVMSAYFLVVVEGTGGHLYGVEGVFTVKLDDLLADNSSGGSSGSSSGSSSSGTAGTIQSTINTKRCNVCQGTGNKKCYDCGGDGWKSCTLCHGTGTYSRYGISSDCSCLAGKVRCSICRGVGHSRCTACGGDGLY